MVNIKSDEKRERDNQTRDALAKLKYLASFVETEEGIFTFPDGDYVVTKKKSNKSSSWNNTNG